MLPASVLINNNTPIPVYTIHDVLEPFTHASELGLCGEFYIDETEIKIFSATIKIEAGFYSGDLLEYLVKAFHMPTRNIKWKITTDKESFKTRHFERLSAISFPESQARGLANSFIGELGRKCTCTKRGFTCNIIDTAQCLWTVGLAGARTSP